MTDRDNGHCDVKLFPGERPYGWALSGHYEYAFQLGKELMEMLGLEPYARVFEIHSNSLLGDPNISRRARWFRESLEEIARDISKAEEEVRLILGFSHNALMLTSVKLFGFRSREIEGRFLDERRRERINKGIEETASANKTDRQRSREMGSIYALFYDRPEFLLRFGCKLQEAQV